MDFSSHTSIGKLSIVDDATRVAVCSLRAVFRSSGVTCRIFLCFWLLATHSTGITAKQDKPKPSIPPIILQRAIFAYSKTSGLSAVLPSSLLDGNNFAVEPATVRNVTTQVGQTTYLHCIVDRADDLTVGSQQRQVSWIRLKDFHLLTVGSYTYTRDTRFQTIYNEYSTDWTLQIKYPQPADEGVYECQISSDPPISHYVNLKVLVPKVNIVGAPNFYVSVGSELNLTCVITDCPEPPAFVFWYHNERMINYDNSRGVISIQKAGEDTAISRLYIKQARQEHSGNYSCCPSNTDSASIFVHVLKGEKHAAVQNDAVSTSRSNHLASSLNFVLLVEVVFCLTSIGSSFFCFR